MDHLVPWLSVAKQEKELVNKQLISGVLVIWICHFLLNLEVFLDLPNILLKVLSLFLLALQEGPVLLDPLPDQHVTRRLVNQSEGPQNYIIFQRNVRFLPLFLDQRECIDACTDLLDTIRISCFIKGT